MKHVKKIMVAVVAVVMVLAMTLTAFADASITKTNLVQGDNAGDASITVTLPTVEEGSTANNTYKIYKVFDAVTSAGTNSGISYTLVSGKKNAPKGFVSDSTGNVTLERTTGNLKELTAEEIAAIKSYVDESMLAATVTTTANDKTFTVDLLPYGYYYITTTTGTVVTVSSTKPNATVSDKNEAPTVTKVISSAEKGSVDEDGKRALAEVGSKVTYKATVTKKKGAENYVFHDKMDDTLSYNNDVKVYSDATLQNEVENTNYDTTPANSDTLTVTFKNEYISNVADNAMLYIVYSATVTSNALQTNPANNTAKLSYGHTSGSNSTPEVGTKTYNAKISVLKKDGKGTEATEDDAFLSDAGFKLYRLVSDDKNVETKQYYKLNNTDGTITVTWGDKAAGDEHKSDDDGKVEAFTGLSDGTYYLEETTTPAGYNTAADTPVTIKDGDYTATNLSQTVTILNNKGTELPSTGGIGTTVFYVIGGILVVIAGVLLVVKRRMKAEK